jgi:hypothetical protein
VHSTSKYTAESLTIHLMKCLVVEALPGSTVTATFFPRCPEVGSFREAVPEQTVCVLIRSTLSGGIRIGKTDGESRKKVI